MTSNGHKQHTIVICSLANMTTNIHSKLFISTAKFENLEVQVICIIYNICIYIIIVSVIMCYNMTKMLNVNNMICDFGAEKY
jgi:cell division protein FtsL